MIYSGEDGLAAVMFPVKQVAVFAETETGRLDPIAGKKAIVNTDSREVLSVVSDRYRLLENREALELARKCCIVAFPNTAPAHWSVFSVEAALTGSYCRMDLTHDGDVLGYDWAFSAETQDRWTPFVRVTNSYNRTRTFSVHFGFERWKCRNGMIDWESIIRIQCDHTGDIGKRIERKIVEAKFEHLASRFKRSLRPLGEKEVPVERFRSVILSVLQIHKPKGLPNDRQESWRNLEGYIDGVSGYFVKELGANAYALLNAITEFATRPPSADLLGYSFVRRQRHTLQQLAGIWLAQFSGSLRRADFDLDAYLRDPSPSALRPLNGPAGRFTRR